MTIATKYPKEELLFYKYTSDTSLEECQLQELDYGIKEVDAGMFARNHEVDRVLIKWLLK